MASRYRRLLDVKEQRPRFLVLIEGFSTERGYLCALKIHLGLRSADLAFDPPPPNTPVEMIKKAKTLKKRATKSDPYDEVWCVFDVEANSTQKSRPLLSQAISAANQSSIRIALSNPCFELWLLLHAKSQEAYIRSEEVQSICKKLKIVDNKHIVDARRLIETCESACQKARDLDKRHSENGTESIEDRNPSSGMHLLVASLRQAFTTN